MQNFLIDRILNSEFIFINIFFQNSEYFVEKIHMYVKLKTSSFNNGIFLTSDGSVRNAYANYLGTIPVLRQQNYWAGGWVGI
jgi:hypothetical protein